MNPDFCPSAQTISYGCYAHNPQAEIFQYRNHIRQRQNGATVEQFETQFIVTFFQLPVKTHRQFARRLTAEIFHMLNISHRRAGGEFFAVAGRKRIAVTVELMIAQFFTHLLSQRCVQVIGPGTHHLLDTADNFIFVKIDLGIRIQAQQKIGTRQNGFRE